MVEVVVQVVATLVLAPLEVLALIAVLVPSTPRVGRIACGTALVAGLGVLTACPGVMGDQLHHHGWDVRVRAQELGAIERMQSRGRQVGGVPDVMQPCSSDHRLTPLWRKNHGQHVGPRSHGLDVPPPVIFDRLGAQVASSKPPRPLSQLTA